MQRGREGIFPAVNQDTLADEIIAVLAVAELKSTCCKVKIIAMIHL